MAARRSKRCPYPSRFGKSRWISAPQYLAELMCSRRAAGEKTPLPLEFWQDKAWGAYFRRQVVAASRLIRLPGPDATMGAKAVSQVLRSESGKKVWSLDAPFLVPLVHKAYRTLLAQEERAGQAPALPAAPLPLQKPRESFAAGESALSKLKGLDT